MALSRRSNRRQLEKLLQKLVNHIISIVALSPVGAPTFEFCVTCIIAGVCLQSCVGGVCSALIAKEEQLNELDRGSGDGDCGSTLKAGVAGKEREI